MNENSVQLMVDRLKAIEWSAYQEGQDKAFSRAALMREYLRRAALWLDAYGDTDEWPFFDLAAVVAPAVRADPAVVSDTEDFVEEASASWHAVECSAAAVQWAALRDTSGLLLPPLPEPFEPLIRLYERGGAGFSYANGFLDFGMLMVKRGTWRSHLSSDPVIELDEDTLDALDERSWAEFRALAARATPSTDKS
ncbi:hypothetical protein ACIRD3_09255 [Kitasatospora sp. NPDC093550]|uniref:hypothetical protein n=1 Tax=Kitasatospora sp. NPDC093550 TaxID=3364089 RepID=UPI00381249D3